MKNEKLIRNVLNKIEKVKIKIGVERDKLRNIYDDLESLLESIDGGVEGLDAGRLEIERAIDSLSEQL
jgi:predicted  nucleic acid-binding Zn-ribbon protein